MAILWLKQKINAARQKSRYHKAGNNESIEYIEGKWNSLHEAGEKMIGQNEGGTRCEYISALIVISSIHSYNIFNENYSLFVKI